MTSQPFLRVRIAKKVDQHFGCKLTKLAEKRDLLRLKVEALEKDVDQFRAQQEKQLTLLEAAIYEKHERMHGLLSYGLATGGLSTDATLLFNTLGDYLQAKSDSDRQAAQRAVALIFEHGDLGDRNDETGLETRF